MTIIIGAGYQFDYVFDWTILKYPQIGSSSRARVRTLFLVLSPYPSLTFSSNTYTHRCLYTCIYMYIYKHTILTSLINSWSLFYQPSGKPAQNAGPSGEGIERPTGWFVSYQVGLQSLYI